MNIPRIIVAATGSGAGKTSLSIALIRCLQRRGLSVQAFKVGPDFLDPSHLAIASGRSCYNLDDWMCGREYVLDLFRRKTVGADIAVVEGVMGLFDGAAPDSSEGSTAEIARRLSAPVLLVADSSGIARSFAAVVKGYDTFEPGLKLAGIIANHCGSDRHADWLREALASSALPPLLGAIPKNALPPLPSRHLGLVTANNRNLSGSLLEKMAEVLEQHVNIDAIIALVKNAPPLELPETSPCESPDATAKTAVSVGIARDEAFHFYYPDNLEALAAAGARLTPFSPLKDSRLPENLDAVYLGGGYPEELAAELAANAAMQNAVRRFAASGGAIYAECGGLMYLSQDIETREGTRHPMTGILPFRTRMRERFKSLGYVEVKLTADTMWGFCGNRLRGHEFHYSEPVEKFTGRDGWQTVYEINRRREQVPVKEGYRRERILASYAHLHFASRPGTARAFVEFVRKGKPS